MPRTLDISEGGVYTHTAAAERSEVESVFTLFPSPIPFIPVPKRAMTPDQQNNFEHFCYGNSPNEGRGQDHSH
jgi:hypothetical protein